jgi:glutathione S-transferase
MVLKIHGSLFSTCTQRVLIVLEEKQVPYEVVDIDFAKQEHKTAQHTKLQPWGKVPVLEDDDGFFLYGL